MPPFGECAAISDLALLGDGATAALADRRGSLRWTCWPRFDSQAIFASLVGNETNGEWRVCPTAPCLSTRRYRPSTAILETRFETDGGVILLTDFMPFQFRPSAIVRRVRGLAGEVEMSACFAPRGEYGRLTPRYSRENGALRAVWDDLALKLNASRPELAVGDDQIQFVVHAGETVDFVLTDAASASARPDEFAQQAEATCERFWRQWTARCAYQGPHRELFVRSLITLKALIYAPSGGMAAAPTASLPEHLGGPRNWDYRFCWLRDSTFAVLALVHAGYDDEASAWTKWLHETAQRMSPRIEIFASVGAGRPVDETEATWLSGFAGSRPVRIGNAARTQLQLGVYGEVQDALHQWRIATNDAAHSLWPLQCAMLESLGREIGKPDSGIWEQRGKQEFFTQSRALAWAAYDRAKRSAAKFGLPADPAWPRLARALHEEICARGYDEKLGSFARAYGSKSLDASCLLMSLVGFLPPEDRRLVGTLEAIRSHLGDGPFLRRYDPEIEKDGLGAEGVFLPCSFWLADNLILLGRQQEAADILEQVGAVANDVGLLSEEYDVAGKQLLGNFPQALTHLGFVHTALNLCGDGPAHRRSQRSD